MSELAWDDAIDDITLTQVMDSIEDKATWDNTIDDVVLSQTADAMEDEFAVFNGLSNLTLSQTADIDRDCLPEEVIECASEMFEELSNLTLSQAVQAYDINMDNISTGIFDLKSDVFDDKSDVVLNKPNEKTRFAKPVDDDDVKKLLSDTESKNTRRNTKWSVGVFEQWRRQRKENVIPDLKDFTVEDVNKWFSKFVMEARKANGDQYPPKTLYLIMTGLLRIMREQGNDINFLDVKRNDCSSFRRVLSAQMSKLTSEGLGTHIKQAEPLTEESERILWDKDVFGKSSAQNLLYTVFFYNCKLFGLRASDEHRQLEAAQITVGRDQQGSFIEFQGKTAKNFNGGLSHRFVQAKTLRHHTSSELPELYELYLSKIGNQGPFYRRPLARRGESELRFSMQVLGVNKLRSLIKDMCNAGGIEGHFSNHSVKRTYATRLYEAGVEEQEIMSITGHRSLEAVRKYKRPSESMLIDISNKLDPPKRVKVESTDSQLLTLIPASLPAVVTPISPPLAPVMTPPQSPSASNSAPPMNGSVIYQNCIFNNY